MSSVADYFAWFVEAAAPTSPLYAELAQRTVEDDELLTLAGQIPIDKLPANLLFGAVHYLLLEKDYDAPLADFYASLTPDPRPANEAFPAFRAFVLEHATEISHLLQWRRVNTNELRRAAVLMPAFALAARQGEPLHMVEIGTSAGFLLNWHRLGYDYGAAGRVLPVPTPALLTCAAEGPLPLPEHLPAVETRIGLDLDPLDVRDSDDAQWLRALIWPEQRERAERLEIALALTRQDPPTLIKGDALKTLEPTLANLPAHGTTVVFHAFALAQFPPAAKTSLLALLDRIGRTQGEIWRIGCEIRSGSEAELTLQVHGRGPERLLALAQQHGESIRWLAAD